MKTNHENTTIHTWKQQLDGATRIVEAETTGSIRAGEAQLRAAADTQKSIDAARKMFDSATDVQQLWRIQNEWIAAGMRRSFTLWNELQQAVAETQTSVSRHLYDPAAALLPQANALPEASQTAFGLFDDAYRRWRETTLQIWGASNEIAQQMTLPSDGGRDETAGRKHNDSSTTRKRQNA
jgi:hypothetical protein